jgi:hypothetical protein
MKRTLWVVWLLFSVALFAQAAPQNPLEQAVLKLEQEWVEALIKADTAKLETLYADTLVYTHSSGSVDDKAKYLANLKAGGTKYLSINRDDIKVNLYGDTAVVTDSTVDARMLHVYAKVKGRWQMVAHQTTRLG